MTAIYLYNVFEMKIVEVVVVVEELGIDYNEEGLSSDLLPALRGEGSP